MEKVFQGLQNAHELGSLLQIEQPVEAELRSLQARYSKLETKGGVQSDLFREVPIQERLPVGVESYEEWKTKTLARLREHFHEEAHAVDPAQAFFSQSAEKGLAFFDLLARRYDVVANKRTSSVAPTAAVAPSTLDSSPPILPFALRQDLENFGWTVHIFPPSETTTGLFKERRLLR